MLYMQRPLTQKEIQLFLSAFQNQQVKAELAKHVRMQIDARSNQYDGRVQSYDALVTGDVNMMNRLAAAGYDVYGKTILKSNNPKAHFNDEVYKRLRNRIRYRQGAAPDTGYQNRGNFSIF